ncbi:SH3 domain-containing protein [Desulfolutivibrio sulfoxidireducens]|uniref:SH3 domain-containing protein n=1 Tax=Desulfolutivibrio sulfoxidireducens TaxID=2773299 RepID=UPI00159DB7E2|nr:SH3 domain-containing protein [Desulfolutivibrio sulfoxidireducens]QLA14879.1 SH3 domain-containing protein [Desulfolutivibrio sulfoxidireducens]QLA18448.1 SH3 domain-containing protein [Desulfolutivibrio sulfoxidireducens]
MPPSSRLSATLCLLACLAAFPALSPTRTALAADPMGAGRLVVADDGHDLRAAADAKAASLGALLRGELATVLARQGKWANVRTQDGRTGWVPGSVLRAEDAYLKDPANRDFVMCPSDAVRTFPVIPKGRQDIAALVLRDVPSLLGGDAQATLTDAAGKILWRGPTQGAGTDPLVFFCRDFGSYWPQAAGDLDGDGMIEVLAQDPQSDVSVSSFTMVRFSHDLVPGLLFSGRGLVEAPMGSGRFLWDDPDFPHQNVRWIMDVTAVAPDGALAVSVYEFGGRTGSELRTGQAKVRLEADGAYLTSWTRPMAKPAQ